MATKSLAEKLLIKPNTTVWSSHASRLDLIQPLSENVRHVDRLEQATTALVFADDAGSLRGILTAHKDHLVRAEQLLGRLSQGEPRRPQPRQPVADPRRVRHATGRAGVGGRGLVRASPPSSQGRRGALHGWAIAGSDGARRCAGADAKAASNGR
jgi:hypothetical protein